MKRLVREQRLGFIATVCPDGTPNLSPKGSTAVWDDDHLVFADVESPRTIRNIVEHPWVEINVVDPVLRRGYRFKGKGEVLRSGADYWKVLEMYKSDGADVRRIRAIVRVEVAFAAPLVSPVYGHGVTEDRVRDSWEEYFRKLRAREGDAGRPLQDI
jgi:predicted pyridoxine 5'-phosphate oxidase superfamily flavin-nucleotide-binding protein